MVERADHALFIPERAAVAQDILHHVADQAFVLFELSGEADELAILFAAKNGFGCLEHLVPGLRRRDRIFFQEIFSVIEQAGVDEHRHAKNAAAIAIRRDRGRKKLFLLDGGEIAIERQCPARRCKLCRPDRIHKKNIEPRVAVFEFLRQKIVDLGGRLRRDLANHFDTGIFPFEIRYGLVPNLSGFRFPGDKMENVLLRERLRCVADKKKGEEDDEGSHENHSDE